MPDRIPYYSDRTDDDRKESQKFYSSKRWTNCRKSFLARNPLCERCRNEGRITAATIAHHRIERLSTPSYTHFDHSNLEALCPSCHTKHNNMKDH